MSRPIKSSERVQTAYDWFDVTPHDTNELSIIPTAIYVGVAGIVKAESTLGSIGTFDAVKGATLLIQPKRILATGTTATGLVALVN